MSNQPGREPDTFYRLSGDWTKRPAWVADTLAGLVDTGQLVPVEVDYEAAANGYGIGLQEAMDIVNLALGIEGGDGE